MAYKLKQNSLVPNTFRVGRGLGEVVGVNGYIDGEYVQKNENQVIYFHVFVFYILSILHILYMRIVLGRGFCLLEVFFLFGWFLLVCLCCIPRSLNSFQ